MDMCSKRLINPLQRAAGHAYCCNPHRRGGPDHELPSSPASSKDGKASATTSNQSGWRGPAAAASPFGCEGRGGSSLASWGRRRASPSWILLDTSARTGGRVFAAKGGNPPKRIRRSNLSHGGGGAWVNSTLVYCIISYFVMLGYSKAANIKPLPGIFKQVILITMRNPQSHPNITTIIL